MPTNRSHSADEAGVGPDPKQVRHLAPLRELRKWRVARGEPDIRGWRVLASNGREVGHVVDLLVDDTIAQVVMFDIVVERTGARVLVPIRAAWVDRAHRRVIIDGAQVASGDDVLPKLGREPPEPPRAAAAAVAAGDGGTAGAQLPPAVAPPAIASGERPPAPPAPPAPKDGGDLPTDNLPPA